MLLKVHESFISLILSVIAVKYVLPIGIVCLLWLTGFFKVIILVLGSMAYKKSRVATISLCFFYCTYKISSVNNLYPMQLESFSTIYFFRNSIDDFM